MAYRVDPDGKSWYDNNGVKHTSSPEQQKLFSEQIEQAESLRAQAGGPAEIDPNKEQLFIVEKGDNLWNIAKENDVSFQDILASNDNDVNDGGNSIDINDVIILPNKSPKLVAESEANAEGVPSGEEAFRNEIYNRGNQLQYDDNATSAGIKKEQEAIAADVGQYLDSLPPEERQAAVARLLGNEGDWQDSNAGLVGIQEAAKQRNLEYEPTTAFASQLYTLGNKLEYNDNTSTDFKAEQGKITQFVKDRLNDMPEGDRQKFLQTIYDRNWTDSGPSQIAIEQVAKDLNIELRPSTHRGPETEATARGIIDKANTSGKPDEAFIALNEAYAKASPEVQEALKLNPESKKIIDDAASWATERLATYDPKTAESEQGDAAEVMRKLELLTREPEGSTVGGEKTPNLSTELITAALPTIEKANERKQEEQGGSLIGREGQQNLTLILGRLQDSPQRNAVFDRFSTMGNASNDPMLMSIGTGSALDFPLSQAVKSGDDGYLIDNAILPGVQSFAGGAVNSSVDKYLEHEAELQWLVANHGATMTPEQLEKAIADYKAEKGSGWQDDEKRLEADVIANGEKLLTQLTQLGNLPPELASQKEKADKVIKDIMSDEKNVFAMQMAMREHPELLEHPDTVNMLGAQARLTDRGRKLAEEAATLMVRNELLPTFANIDPNNSAGLSEAQAGIEKMKDGRLAKLLGISDDEFNKALSIVKDNLPAAGDSEQQMLAKLKDIDTKLNDPANGFKSFKNTEIPGQILRMIGVAGTGMGLAATISKLDSDPSMYFKAVIDVAGLSQRSIELMHGFKHIDSDSFAVQHFGSSSKPLVKFLGAAGACFDLFLAGRSMVNNDWQMGTLQAVTGAGGITAALGTGTAFGPIGLAVVGVGVIGQIILQNVRESNKYMTDTSMRFLEHSGLTAEVADALVDQSGDGYSPVPLLVKYAESKGYSLDNEDDRKQFINWLNGIPKDKLDTLRDNLHHTLDDLDGDVSKFPSNDDKDENFTDPAKLNEPTERTEHSSNAWEQDKNVKDGPSLADSIRSGYGKPQSVAQIDVVVSVLGIDALPPA